MSKTTSKLGFYAVLFIVTISSLNAFYYFIFSIAFLIFTYEPSNYSFYFLAILLIISTLYPIIQWSVSLYQHVLIRAFFTKKDIVYKLSPILLLLFAWAFNTKDSMQLFVQCSTYLSFILFVVPLFLKSFEITFTYPMKMLKNQVNSSVMFSSPNIIKFNWNVVNDMIKKITNSSYYIVDNCNFDLGSINIFSGGKKIQFNYENSQFVVDGISISSSVVMDMQNEYHLKFFDMNDDQLELIKMISI